MDINFLNEKLKLEKAELEKELGNLGVKDEKTGDWQVLGQEVPKEDLSDKNDMGDRDEDFSEKNDILNELEIRYNEIVRAMDKIERNDDTYGKCEIGGEVIEEDRLRANPAATTCKKHME